LPEWEAMGSVDDSRDESVKVRIVVIGTVDGAVICQICLLEFDREEEENSEEAELLEEILEGL
jgi:hypothetical protein